MNIFFYIKKPRTESLSAPSLVSSSSMLSNVPKMDSTRGPLRSCYLSISEKLCAVVIPFLGGIFEAVVLSLVSCFDPHPPPSKLHYTFNELHRIAKSSLFTVNEVEALLDLYKKLSSSIIDDGLIHKEELQLALLKNPAGKNIFLDRVFDLFDQKKHGAIEFEDFVYALNVFHPQAPMEDKIDFAFRIYDLRQTGFIEREEVRQMLNAILMETGVQLSQEVLEAVVDKTFADADADKDGKINKEEWREYVIQRPTLLKHMTLPCLKEITTVFPSFVFNTEVDD